MDGSNVLAVQAAPTQTIVLSLDPITLAAIADLKNMVGQMYGEMVAQTQILQRLEESSRAGVPLTQTEVNAEQARYDEFSRQAAALLDATADAGMPTASDIWGAVANVDPETDPDTLSALSALQGAKNAATEANAATPAVPTQEEYATLEHRWFFANPPHDQTIMVREERDTLDDNGKQIGVEDTRPATPDERRIIQYFNRKAPGQTRGGRSRPRR